jgi:exopolysaccharide production protein ExoZ
MDRPPRLVNLQILRAVAATLVVWAHAIDLSNERSILAFGNLENFGAFGVDLFFVLSGYIITVSADRSDRNWLQFAIDRFVRIAPIFYILSLPWIIRAFLLPDHSWLPFLPTMVFWPIVEGKYIEPFLPVGWTLSFEVLFYFAMTAAIFLGSWVRRPAAMLVILFFIVMIIGRSLNYDPTLNFLGNPIIVEFLFGIGISMLFQLTGPNLRLAVGMSALATLALGYGLTFGFGDISEAKSVQMGDLSWQRAITWGLPAAGIVYATLLLGDSSPSGKIKHTLYFLGDASYSIYLVHVLVIAGFKTLDVKDYVSGDLLIIAIITCSLLAGSLSYLYIEKPTIEFFNRLRNHTYFRSGSVRLPRNLPLY